VLDKQLADKEFIIGDEITIADFAIFPWYGSIMRGGYSAQEFLSTADYKNVERWVAQMEARQTVKRGQMVNSANRPGGGLAERHDAGDFDALLNAPAEA